ncbi:MAG: MraY family glycosyltransferase [Gammaproteobacteria bacterium]
MPSAAHLTLYGLSASFATAILILLIKAPAVRIGLVDRPGGRKKHEGAVPLCGGPAMVVAFCSLVFAFGLVPSTDYLGFLVGASLLALVGGLDDFRGLSVHLRFLVQVLVVLFCMGLWGNTELVTVGDLLGLGEIELGFAAVPFTLFCVVGVINAFNLSDGIDGLAGGIAVIALSSFAVAALIGKEVLVFALLTVLIGVSLGFLLFNLRTPWRPRASVFMGDSGSLFLGFALCWFAVKLSQGDGRAISAVTAGWILGLPIMDTLNVMLSRILRGDGPFTAGRDHLHHALLQAGFSPRRTVTILLTIGGVMSITALAAHWSGVPEPLMFFAWIALFVMYFFGLRHFWRLRAPAVAAHSLAVAALSIRPRIHEMVTDLDPTTVPSPVPPHPQVGDIGLVVDQPISDPVGPSSAGAKANSLLLKGIQIR